MDEGVSDSQRLTCSESSREGTRCTVGSCEGQLKTCLSNIMLDSEKASEKNSILEVKKHLHTFSIYLSYNVSKYR